MESSPNFPKLDQNITNHEKRQKQLTKPSLLTLKYFSKFLNILRHKGFTKLSRIEDEKRTKGCTKETKY